VKRILILIAVAALGLAAVTGWQIAEHVLRNDDLRNDVQHFSSQWGPRAGYEGPNTEADVRTAVVREAKWHGIQLQPEEVKVTRVGHGDEFSMHIEVAYQERINLLLFSFPLHLTAASVN
jgi:hypothetical protein